MPCIPLVSEESLVDFRDKSDYFYPLKPTIEPTGLAPCEGAPSLGKEFWGRLGGLWGQSLAPKRRDEFKFGSCCLGRAIGSSGFCRGRGSLGGAGDLGSAAVKSKTFPPVTQFNELVKSLPKQTSLS